MLLGHFASFKKIADHTLRLSVYSLWCQKPPTFIAATMVGPYKSLVKQTQGVESVTKEATRYLAGLDETVDPGVKLINPRVKPIYASSIG